MRLLVVEDENIVAEYLRRSLKAAGHEVDLAENGEVGLRKAATKFYDVVILDILMPKKNGLQVCEELRQKNIHTPILFLTSLADDVTKVKGLDSGGDDYLMKPFSFLELEARLRALYRRPKSMVGEQLHYHDIRLNTTEHKVWLSNNPIDMRSKEFSVLAYLLRNQGRVISREELFNTIWGVEAENASNRVDACIKEIRRKVGKERIKTISKTGYYLAE